MKEISWIVAFSAGLFSFLSPCVLPMIPAYVSYLTGAGLTELTSGKSKLTVLYKSIGFILGFSLVFVIMGASISSLGQLLSAYQGIFRRAGGILIIVFGIHTAGIFKIKLFYSEKRWFPENIHSKNLGSLFLGMAFAAGWTPCVGPILSSILIYAGSMNTVSTGILLLVFYSLGLAIPFILTALAIESFTKYFKRYSRFLPAISTISGILLIIFGILIFFNKLAVISGYFNFLPSF
ncbi:MAG: cytochrome c biogenesis protein CcdA [Clostridia bacterium]|nr:cytochrome c biogenesis protein CcdA [Clostridia bacterium]